MSDDRELKPLFSKREEYLMEACFNAGSYYDTLPKYLDEMASDCHTVAQVLDGFAPAPDTRQQVFDEICAFCRPNGSKDEECKLCDVHRVQGGEVPEESDTTPERDPVGECRMCIGHENCGVACPDYKGQAPDTIPVHCEVLERCLEANNSNPNFDDELHEILLKLLGKEQS